MLGKVFETTCRLNIYLTDPGKRTKAVVAEAWGFGQVSGRKCLVARDGNSGGLQVLGEVRTRSSIPREDMGLMARVRIVEEGLAAADRGEWMFFIEPVDEQTRNHILHGPLIEPGPLVGEGLHL
ncbi:hypothetical protein HZB60_10895 [candidate division KSB1 bacterium]|nr:hypothetical protein [candidate division KSB1 bacterium]